MKSQVCFLGLRTGFGKDIFTKLGKLLDKAGLDNFVRENDMVALKMHFGEEGTTAYINPQYVRFIAERVKRRNALVFLTDTNVLYGGRRGNSVDHLHTAFSHGFSPLATGVPVIISGGVRGQAAMEVEIGQKHFETVKIASEIADVDRLICLTHLTGHLATGFGGAMKNLGMGLAAKPGKLAMHSTVFPSMNHENCTGCGTCQKHCPAGAISLQNREVGKGKFAAIDFDTCIGCGECIATCPNRAVEIVWNESTNNLQEKICEYAYGVVKSRGPVLFLNFLTNITPGCDCMPYSDVPIVPDIGVLASFDPVAIDQASVDLINQQESLSGPDAETHLGSGEEKFLALYPKVDYTVQLRYGEKIGLGSREYELISVEKQSFIP